MFRTSPRPRREPRRVRCRRRGTASDPDPDFDDAAGVAAAWTEANGGVALAGHSRLAMMEVAFPGTDTDALWDPSSAVDGHMRGSGSAKVLVTALRGL